MRTAISDSDTSSPVLRFDVIAGLTAAAVVLPKAMAYATVAGLPVSVGLYTAFVPMIVYALLGTSQVLSVSSTTTLAILTGAELGLAVPDGDPGKLITATATLTALTGALLIGASLLRLGFVANLISTPVLTGFKAGIGMVIVLDQIPKLLGIHITKEGFFRDILSVVHHVPETSLITLTVAVVALLALLAMERMWPHSPAPLVVVSAGISASWLFGLSALGVGTVGVIPQSLPSVTLPSLGLVELLLPGALGIAVMSFTETIAAFLTGRRSRRDLGNSHRAASKANQAFSARSCYMPHYSTMEMQYEEARYRNAGDFGSTGYARRHRGRLCPGEPQGSRRNLRPTGSRHSH
jgi:SulP family sulfate permease